jgi:putative SOS response-associated peptidase YedK
MCGRFTLFTSLKELTDRFGFDSFPVNLNPSYNITPTQPVLTVRNIPGDTKQVQADFMRWGLIPAWAKDASLGGRMINARSETASEKPSFRSAFRKRRCLILADGFYEWRKVSTGKQPVRIQMKGGSPFAFAGLWESWRNREGGEVHSCTILTMSANSFMKNIHDRMPLILQKNNESKWLDSSRTDPEEIKEMIQEFPNDYLESWDVSKLVNIPTNNNPECIEPEVRLL